MTEESEDSKDGEYDDNEWRGALPEDQSTTDEIKFIAEQCANSEIYIFNGELPIRNGKEKKLLRDLENASKKLYARQTKEKSKKK